MCELWGGEKIQIKGTENYFTFYYTIKYIFWYMKYMKKFETLGKLFLAFYCPRRIIYSVIYRAWSGFM